MPVCNFCFNLKLQLNTRPIAMKVKVSLASKYLTALTSMTLVWQQAWHLVCLKTCRSSCFPQLLQARVDSFPKSELTGTAGAGLSQAGRLSCHSTNNIKA